MNCYTVIVHAHFLRLCGYKYKNMANEINRILNCKFVFVDPAMNHELFSMNQPQKYG